MVFPQTKPALLSYYYLPLTEAKENHTLFNTAYYYYY